MARISASPQSGITPLELKEAIPESLLSKNIHLHWIDKSPAADGMFTVTAKIEVDGEALLLRCLTDDEKLMSHWNNTDPTYHTNARLLALERILTDPDNEDILLSL